MYLAILLASFFALTAWTLPLSGREASDLKCETPGSCYHIFNLTASEPSGRPGSDNLVHFRFTLQDTAPNATTICSASWAAGTDDWPKQKVHCDDEDLRWSFSKFESITEWNMEATHDFPMGNFGARSYANGSATSDDFDCQTAASGAKHCSLKDDRVINLGIYALIA